MAKVNFTVTRKDVQSAIFIVLEACAKSATVFVRRSGKVVGKIRACSIKKHGWGNVRLTVGRLNYAEREYHKKNPSARVWIREGKTA